MSRDHDNLLRGQGLFRQAISGFAIRWKAYGLTVASIAAIGGIGLPYKQVEAWQFVCAYQHGQGELVSLFAGKSDAMVTVSVDGRSGQLPAKMLANDPMWIRCWEDIKTKGIIGGLLGGMLGFGLCFGLAIWMRDHGRKAGLDKFISGTRIVSEKVLRSLTKRGTDERSLRIATVGIPPWLECRHFAIVGTTGAGKTTVLRQMLDKVEARGEPALVYDTRHVRAAVIESEMRLEPHHGFLQLPDALPVAKIRLTRDHIDARGAPRQRGFVPVDVSRSLWGKLPIKGAKAEKTINEVGPV